MWTEFQVTKHARQRMDERGVTEEILVEVLKGGQTDCPKSTKLKNNRLSKCLDFPDFGTVEVIYVIEEGKLVVITVLVYRRPD